MYRTVGHPTGGWIGNVGRRSALFKGDVSADDLICMTVRETCGQERGATLVEYAVVFSLIVIGSLLAIEMVTTESGTYLSSTGTEIGEPREHIADMDPDLPDPPAWITP
jgi:Flp pilus assembly pilin Flp